MAHMTNILIANASKVSGEHESEPLSKGPKQNNTDVSICTTWKFDQASKWLATWCKAPEQQC